MSKIAVVYYSGSGNTEAMADVIVNAIGADKIEAGNFGAAKASEYDAIAFGCPAMGDEVLEETVFQPMWDVGGQEGCAVWLLWLGRRPVDARLGGGRPIQWRDPGLRERHLQRSAGRRSYRRAGGAGEGHWMIVKPL